MDVGHSHAPAARRSSIGTTAVEGARARDPFATIDVRRRTMMLNAALDEVLELTSVGMVAYREALIAELDALRAA